MIGAPSFADVPEVELPLDVSGRHAIYVGYWNPRHDYDGGTTVKVRLADDPCFTRFREPETEIDYHGTYLREAFFKNADLTGRRIVFGKLTGPFAQKAYVAYVKLVPLDDAAVAALQADPNCADSRVVEAVIDGISFFHHDEYRTESHILELVEPCRHTDVGKVTWAFCYGDLTNYPTKVGTYQAWEEKSPFKVPPVCSPHAVGTMVANESLKTLAAQGVIPQAAVARHVHEMGLKFEAMFRLAMFGHVPPRHWGPVDKAFVATHPQFRQVTADGTPIEKASYAFPEVREHMLAIIRESAEMFDIDSAALAFNRGPQFTAYEQPVLDDLDREFPGEDARAVPMDDPRMQQVRARYLTELVRGARRVLDEVGAAKGKRLELNVWVYCKVESNLIYGFDVETWVREGLLDSVVASVGPSGGSLDPELIAMCKAGNCRCTPALIPWRCEDPASDALEYLYPEGADGMAIWDADHLPRDHWLLLSRLGHREELAATVRNKKESKGIQLKNVAGCDVAEGLGPAAYSAG